MLPKASICQTRQQSVSLLGRVYHPEWLTLTRAVRREVSARSVGFVKVADRKDTRLTSVLKETNIEVKVSESKNVEIESEKCVGRGDEGEDGERGKDEVSEMHREEFERT